MTNPKRASSLPEIDLNISVQTVVAKPRKLKMTWSSEAVDDLVGPTRPTNALDLLNDALSDPDYDPSDKDYKGLWRWRSDGRLATPEEVRQWNSEGELVAQMADEMSAAIDREIIASLAESAVAVGPLPIVEDDQTLPPIPAPMEQAIAAAPVDAWCKDAARRIISKSLAKKKI